MQDEPPSDEGTGTSGVDQFQRAALDAVHAFRAMLDAAESIIKDPAAVESVVQTVTALARNAGETVVGFAAGASGVTAERTEPDDGTNPGFERIRVD